MILASSPRTKRRPPALPMPTASRALRAERARARPVDRGTLRSRCHAIGSSGFGCGAGGQRVGCEPGDPQRRRRRVPAASSTPRIWIGAGGDSGWNTLARASATSAAIASRARRPGATTPRLANSASNSSQTPAGLPLRRGQHSIARPAGGIDATLASASAHARAAARCTAWAVVDGALAAARKRDPGRLRRQRRRRARCRAALPQPLLLQRRAPKPIGIACPAIARTRQRAARAIGNGACASAMRSSAALRRAARRSPRCRAKGCTDAQRPRAPATAAPGTGSRRPARELPRAAIRDPRWQSQASLRARRRRVHAPSERSRYLVAWRRARHSHGARNGIVSRASASVGTRTTRMPAAATAARRSCCGENSRKPAIATLVSRHIGTSGAQAASQSSSCASSSPPRPLDRR